MNNLSEYASTQTFEPESKILNSENSNIANKTEIIEKYYLNLLSQNYEILSEMYESQLARFFSNYNINKEVAIYDHRNYYSRWNVVDYDLKETKYSYSTLRAAALKRIEARTDGAVGGSLEAVVRLFPATEAHRARAAEVEPELRFFFSTSDVRLERVGTDLPPTTGETALDGAFHVFVEATHDPKCVRCWHHRPDVGTHASHPELCGRCVANVDGPGEVRHWF